MKPLLLVDVDGVLNCFGPKTEVEAEFTMNGFNIAVPKGTFDRMMRLEKVFDCVWATTWEHDAPNLLAPKFGFGEDWPVILFTSKIKDWKTWKMPSVMRWIGENASDRKWAWIDDDFWEDALEVAHNRDDMLLWNVNLMTGLTERDTEMLLKWGERSHNVRTQTI